MLHNHTRIWCPGVGGGSLPVVGYSKSHIQLPHREGLQRGKRPIARQEAQEKQDNTMSLKLDVGYPLYGAAFATDHSLVVTGGGGEGNNGIANKMSSVGIKQDKLIVTDDYEFAGVNDSPTALALEKGTLLVSLNAASSKLKQGENDHLKKYKFNADEEHNFELIKAVNLLQSKDPLDYIKAIVLSKDASMALVLNATTPPSLKLIDVDTMEVKQVLSKDEEDEIRDIAISPSGNAVAYITEKKLVLHNLETKESWEHERFTSNYLLTKVELIEDEAAIIGINLKNKAGILLLESRVVFEDQGLKPRRILKTKKARVITDKVTKITALDVSLSGQIVAIAGNDNSITIADLDDFSTCKCYPKVHTFAITKITVSPNGEYVASVSAASTISVIKLPSNIRAKYTLLKWAAVILIISFVVNFIRQNITDEQFNTFNRFMHDLFDDGSYTPEEFEALRSSLSSQQAAITETGSIGDAAETAFAAAGIVLPRESTVSFESSLEPGLEFDIEGDVQTAFAVRVIDSGVYDYSIVQNEGEANEQVTEEATEEVTEDAPQEGAEPVVEDEEQETVTLTTTETVVETIEELDVEADGEIPIAETTVVTSETTETTTEILIETKTVIEEGDIVKVVEESHVVSA